MLFKIKFEIKNAVTPLLLITIAIYLLQILLGDPFKNAFILISKDILFRPWILITYMFFHANPYHLFFNMYVLYSFGPLLEQRIGAKKFLFTYLLAGITAAFVSSFFYNAALGASGAIMGMLGVLIILMPDLKLLFFFLVPMQLWVAAIIIALTDVFGIFYPSGIGNIAHLVGMATGILYAFYLKKERKKFQKKFSRKADLSSVDIEEYLRSGRI